MGKDVVRPWSQRLTENVIKQLEEVKEDSGIETFSLLFETMIERYYNPIKINQENDKIIEDLSSKLTEFKAEYEKLHGSSKNEIDERENIIKELNSKISDHENYDVTQRSNISEVQSKNLSLETEIAQLHEKLKNSVYVGPFNMRVLQRVAERETKNRGKEWNKSQIVNCILDSRFVKGTLNAGFDSLPDHVINEIKKEIQ